MAGAEYAFTGKTTVNLLNLDMLGMKGYKDSTVSGGLFAVSFDKDEGFSATVSSAGYDVSAMRFADAAKSISYYEKAASIKQAANAKGLTDNAAKALMALQSTTSNRDLDSKNKQMYADILSGKTKVEANHDFGNEKEDGNTPTAKTVDNGDGTKTVFLAGGMNDWQHIAVVLSHESERDGLKGTDEQQRQETQRAVITHTLMASQIQSDYGSYSVNASLRNETNVLRTGGAAALANYADANYDSSSDYWKVRVEKGKILADWDGTQDVTLPDRTVIKADKDNGKVSAGKLSEMLFGSTAMQEQLETQFNKAGAVWDGKKNGWTTYKGDGQIISNRPQDYFAVDLTSIVDNSQSFNGKFQGWIEGGMKGTPLADMGGLPDGTFGIANRSRLLDFEAGFIGNMDGSPVDKVNNLRGSLGYSDTVMKLAYLGADKYAEQFNRMHTAFVDHIGNTILPSGVNGVDGGDAIAVYDATPVTVDAQGRTVHAGGDININVPYPDWDFGENITTPFGGRTATANTLDLTPRILGNAGRLTYESGFTFGGKFFTTGLFGGPSHALINDNFASATLSNTKYFDPGTIVGTINHINADNNHLHQELMSDPQRTDAQWFENLFNKTPGNGTQFYRSDLRSAADPNTILRRKYYNIDTIWNNLWKPAKPVN